MTPRKMRNFRIDPGLEEGLRAIRERDGIAESEQIRRGIAMWLESKNVVVKAERKRAGTRKHS